MVVLNIPRTSKEEIAASVQDYFTDELGMPIGNLEAELLVDFIAQKVGPFVYNQAIGDARKAVSERMLALEDELYVLEKSVNHDRR